MTTSITQRAAQPLISHDLPHVDLPADAAGEDVHPLYTLGFHHLTTDAFDRAITDLQAAGRRPVTTEWGRDTDGTYKSIEKLQQGRAGDFYLSATWTDDGTALHLYSRHYGHQKTCTVCGGGGEITVTRSTTIPRDPQMDEDAACPACYGTGITGGTFA